MSPLSSSWLFLLVAQLVKVTTTSSSVSTNVNNLFILLHIELLPAVIEFMIHSTNALLSIANALYVI